ncbi:Bifunctional inhibitor/plant lipid transfer protein/seed storage helical domain [Sesbania bispinosa]|nr:Bifunctional inhibitor/plant lipid transfer protein/seed storage helical domain [Sesbania bispinosa]
MAIRCLAMLILTTSILVLGNLPNISGQFECAPDLGAIVTECEPYVAKQGPQTPPSKDCCDALKGADFPCLCKYVTGIVEKLISFDKATYVANTCHVKTAPPGTKCGSFTVPSSPPSKPAPPPKM